MYYRHPGPVSYSYYYYTVLFVSSLPRPDIGVFGLRLANMMMTHPSNLALIKTQSPSCRLAQHLFDAFWCNHCVFRSFELMTGGASPLRDNIQVYITFLQPFFFTVVDPRDSRSDLYQEI